MTFCNWVEGCQVEGRLMPFQDIKWLHFSDIGSAFATWTDKVIWRSLLEYACSYVPCLVFLECFFMCHRSCTSPFTHYRNYACKSQHISHNHVAITMVSERKEARWTEQLETYNNC